MSPGYQYLHVSTSRAIPWGMTTMTFTPDETSLLETALRMYVRVIGPRSRSIEPHLAQQQDEARRLADRIAANVATSVSP